MTPSPSEFEREQLRQLLEGRIQLLDGEIDDLTKRRSEPGSQIQYGKRAGDHIAEVTDNLSRARAAEQLSKLAEQARVALDRLEAGRYGSCEVCGSAIAKERLEALPWAVRCVACAEKR